MSKINIPTLKIPTVASAYADVLGNDSSNQIIAIPNEQIIENNKQNFKIHEDTIEQLAERIAKDGQLNPCIVSPLPDGKYELIDGRHRRRAVIKAGIPTTKCIIRTDLTEKQKVSFRISLNLFRNNDYLPSEIALSLKELVEIEDSYDAIKKISEETNTSKKKIYRYLRLTNLIKPLLDRVDNGSIPVIAAVELSYLSNYEQGKVFEYLLNHTDIKVTTALAKEIKNNPDSLDEICYPASNVDKLSDLQIDDKNKEEYTDNNLDKLSNLDIAENEVKELKVDSVDNLSNLDSNIEVNQITDELAIVISSTLLDKSLMKLMILKMYSTDEVIEYIRFNYVKGHSGGFRSISSQIKKYDNANLSYEYGKKLYLAINGTSYELTYKELDKYFRMYIRQCVDKQDIIAMLSER